MIELHKCHRLLEDGFSLLTVGDSKKPNYVWKKFQSEQITKSKFDRQYNYNGGYFYTVKDGNDNDIQIELPATKNIGIVTGYGDLEVVDVDLKTLSTAKEQREWWDEYINFLEDNIADFHDIFVIAKTMNNGYHILYKSKRVEPCTKISKLKNHKEYILESKGIGGYVFIYDKFLNNKSYQDIQYISDEDREILWNISETYNYIEPKDVIIPNNNKENFQDNNDGLKPWDDFNNKNNVWDIVSNDFNIVKHLKDKYIIKRIGATSTHSGYIFKDNDTMYLHSSNTIYEAKNQYSAWSAYVRKNFNDDFSAAAKQAYKDGYGARIVKKELAPKLKEENIILNHNDLSFPIEVFPIEIQSYINQCAITLNSSIDYMGCSLLWLLSLCVGNAYRIRVKEGWHDISTIWIAIVGKAGVGKTPSITNIISPLEKINDREISNYIEKYREFEHYDNLTKKEKEDYPEILKPNKRQFIANDITLEALVALHEENPNAVGVFKDELAGWFKDMNKYKPGSDLEFWLSTWSGKSVNLNRITRAGSFVSSPLLPVLGGIQPSIFNTFYTDENKDNGFMDRMLLCYPELKVEKFNRKVIDKGIIEWYDDVIISFYEQIKAISELNTKKNKVEPVYMQLDDEAVEEYIRFHDEIGDHQNSETENEYMKSMYPKQKYYLTRFTLLIHMFRIHLGDAKDDKFIDKESVLMAEKLCKYFIAMAKKIKVESVETKDIKNSIKSNSSKSNKEKFEAIYKVNPSVNITEISEQLGVSIQMVYRYKKQIDEKK